MEVYFYKMDATTILERLAKPELLKNDSPQQWTDLVKKHPYFGVGQWLKFGADFYHDNQASLNRLAIYKTEPLEFAKYIQYLKTSKEGKVEEGQTVVEAKAPEQAVVFEETETLIEEVVLEKNEADEEVTNIVETEEKEEIVQEEEVQELVEENVEVAEEPIKETVTKEEDILEMIQELPNSPAFELAKEETLKMESEEVIEEKHEVEIAQQDNSNDESEEDKSLMVMMSFTDWLTHFKHKTHAEREEEKAQKALKAAWQKGKLAEAADEELEEIPEPIFKQAMDSISMESTLISESLAEILAQQGKTDKAIAMYKKLSLRFPEKSTFFANRINELNLNED